MKKIILPLTTIIVIFIAAGIYLDQFSRVQVMPPKTDQSLQAVSNPQPGNPSPSTPAASNPSSATTTPVNSVPANSTPPKSSTPTATSSSNNISSQTSAIPKIDFQNLGAAPDFSGGVNWLNSKPLTISDLKGKVVLVDFWTYSCINCIRTLPYVTKWYDSYNKDGFVVIGVHTPEFDFEKESSNVQDAIKNFGIHYPVVQDNNYKIWNSYSNQYWPAEYLIDQNGNIVYTHFGEGNYDHTENAIRTLLGMNMEQLPSGNGSLSEIGSPEMYFGTSRLQYLSPQQQASLAGENYTFPDSLALNNFALQGDWKFSPENIQSTTAGAKIRLKFHSAKVHIVAQSAKPDTLEITVDGKAQPPVTVSESQLYTLFDSASYADHTIEITAPDAGFQAFTFTFG